MWICVLEVMDERNEPQVSTGGEKGQYASWHVLPSHQEPPERFEERFR